MKLRKLLLLASSGYPDDFVRLYADRPNGNHGDTLAEFIYRELQDTFDESATTQEQLAAAVSAMEKAINKHNANDIKARRRPSGICRVSSGAWTQPGKKRRLALRSSYDTREDSKAARRQPRENRSSA